MYWELILAAPSTLTYTETNTQKNEVLLLDPKSEIMSVEGHWTSAPSLLRRGVIALQAGHGKLT